MSFCFRNIISQIGDWGFRYLKIIQEYNFLKKDILNSYQITRFNFLRKINLTNKLERERITDDKNMQLKASSEKISYQPSTIFSSKK